MKVEKVESVPLTENTALETVRCPSFNSMTLWHHLVTNLHNLCPAASLARKNLFSKDALLLLDVLQLIIF